MLRRLALVSWVAVVFSACGGGTENDGNTPGSGGPIRVDELAEPFAEAICAYFARCLPFADESFPGGCTQYEIPRLKDTIEAQLAEHIRAGTVTYDAARMPACLAAYRTVACGSTEGDVPECSAALDGTVAAGGACRSNIECKGDAYCNTATGCPGVCQPRQGTGAACTDDQHCQGGHTCTGNLCVRDARAGEACGGAGPPCADGLTCAASGKCGDYTRVDAGAECEFFDGSMCKAGLVCAIVSTTAPQYKCVAKSASGGTCSVGFNDTCPAGEYCPISNGSLQSSLTATCKPQGVVDDCNLYGSRACGPFSNCRDDGKCSPMQSIGGSCVDGSDCYSAHCVNGVCAVNLGCG